MPRDHDAERATLGAALLDRRAFDDIGAIVDPDDFDDHRNGEIWRAMAAVADRAEPVDVRTTMAELASRGAVQRIGGAPYLQELLEAPPVSASGTWYARIVLARSRQRQLIVAATRVIQMARQAGVEDTDTLLDRAQGMLGDIDGAGDPAGPVLWQDLIGPAMQALDELASGRAGAGGVPTGFTDLDRLLGGLRPGQLVVVAGRPAMGKSVLLTDIARAAAFAQKLPTALFSLEMGRNEIFARNVAAAGRVPLHALTAGRLSDEDWVRVARVTGMTGDAPLWVDDSAHVTVADVRARARRLQQQHGLQLVEVDYLQLITAARGAENRQVAVAAMARSLKLLAKELQVPVVVAAQLNRGPENRADKKPTLSDLRESGAVEQDADVVILLHREDYYDKESPRRGEVDFIVAKNRNGPTDTVTVANQLHYARFVDMAVVP